MNGNNCNGFLNDSNVSIMILFVNFFMIKKISGIAGADDLLAYL